MCTAEKGRNPELYEGVEVLAFWSYDPHDKNGAGLRLTIYPHQNSTEGVPSLSITVYTDRQLTSALGTQGRIKCVYVDAIALRADDILDVPSSRAEQGWSGSEISNARCWTTNNTIRNQLRLSHWVAIRRRRPGSMDRSGEDEVELEVAVRQPLRLNPWELDMQAIPIIIRSTPKILIVTRIISHVLGFSTCQSSAGLSHP